MVLHIVEEYLELDVMRALSPSWVDDWRPGVYRDG